MVPTFVQSVALVLTSTVPWSPTANQQPSTNSTSLSQIVVPLVCWIQCVALVLVRMVPFWPTATSLPSAYRTRYSQLVVPELLGVQTEASGLVRITPSSPTATNPDGHEVRPERKLPVGGMVCRV